MWHALAILPLLLGSTQAVAQDNYCAATAPTARSVIVDGELNLSPVVRTFLLDITDGKQSAIEDDLRHLRAQFDKQQVSRWLDWALFTATYNDRAAIAEWLIEHGANVNAHPLQPTFDGGQKFPEERMWPPVEQAAACGNAATLKVLLAHHAHMYASIHEPELTPGPLLLAIVEKYEPTVDVLLDYGYDPCLVRANYYHGPTAVVMAKRSGLSDAVTQRLSVLSSNCAAPTPAQSPATH